MYLNFLGGRVRLAAWNLDVWFGTTGELKGGREGQKLATGLERRTVLGKMKEVPSCSNQVFGLDLTGTHLSIFGALLDILYQLFFLVLKLYSLAIELPLGFFKRALVFTEAFLGGHTFSEGPFDDLGSVLAGRWYMSW